MSFQNDWYQLSYLKGSCARLCIRKKKCVFADVCFSECGLIREALL